MYKKLNRVTHDTFANQLSTGPQHHLQTNEVARSLAKVEPPWIKVREPIMITYKF